MNKTFLVATMLLIPAAAHAANTKICFEAEKPSSLQSPLKIVSGKPGKISGGGYLEIPWDGNATKGKGQAGYRFTVKQAGTYTLWARTYWQNGCGNSISVSVNGSAPATIGEDGTYNEWKWHEGLRVKLKAGVNTLVLKNRETGVQVDQFFLCTDPDYIPTSTRKITQ